ncbi:multidrug resistance-associated protein 4-like, partial [Tropilaelaps mercedesae]
ETAGWFSSMLFCWLMPLLKLGCKRALTVEDIYACPVWEGSQHATDRLQEEWEKELSAHGAKGRDPSLLRALWRVYGVRYLLTAILVLVEEVIKNVLQPVALGWLVSYLSDPTKSPMSYELFIGCAALVSFLGGAHIFTHHPYFFNLQRLGMRMRISCCSLLYRKSLRLSQASLAGTASGQMVNLMSNDVRYLDTSPLFVPYLLVAPLQTIIITVILYREIGNVTNIMTVRQKAKTGKNVWKGWPSVCCLGYMLFWVPIQFAIGKKFARIRLQTAEITDRRVRLTNELVAAIRAIKMYAWEKPFGMLVSDVRRLEIGRVRIASILKGVNMALFFVSSKLILFLCCILYTMLAGGSLTSERVFVTMALLNSVRLAMGLYFPYGIGQGLETMVSLRRIQRFLLLEEKSPTTETFSRTGSRRCTNDMMLRLADVRASWTTHVLTSDANGLALSNVNFRMHRGELVIVAGPVGCGKTSLLMAILGELPLLTGTVKLGGNVAYASQVPWLFNATLKRNVCFNSTVDDAKFRKVIKVCALEKDLELLPRAEETLVEDKGTSLSGGQKARVSLARAVYHDADIYLLDDPLSAVDAGVSRHIFTKCIQQHLLQRGKAVVLATHQLQFLRHANRVLLLESNGKPVAYGSYDDIVKSGIDVEGILSIGNDEGSKSDDIYKTKVQSYTDILEEISDDATRLAGDILDASKTFVRLGSSEELNSHPSRRKSQDDVDHKAGETAAMRAQQTEENREIGTVSAAVYWRYANL